MIREQADGQRWIERRVKRFVQDGYADQISLSALVNVEWETASVVSNKMARPVVDVVWDHIYALRRWI